MHPTSLTTIFTMNLSAVATLALLIVGTLAPTQAGDITSGLLAKVQNEGKADAVLALPSIMGSVLSNPVLNFMSGSAKANFMTGLMKQMTTSAQAPFMSALQSFGVESIQPFWVTNKLSLKGVNMQTLQGLQSFPGVFTVREPLKVKLISPVAFEGNQSYFKRATDDPTWGVKKIGAPSLWSKTKGNGVLVANIDTGVNWLHEALSGNYAGQWHDAMPEHETQPYDDNGHGTHVMGTICGQTNGIGVAPEARWIACKGLGPQGGNENTLSECAQWFLDLEEKPAVIANSWGGGQADKFFNDEISAWRAVDIIPVFAIGNDGSRCETAGSPGDQPNLISVGATQSDDKMASFSSRGPVKGSRKKTTKPEVSAPGHQIYSAWNDGDYKTISGTSMACPHVAGAIALMKGVNPDMKFDEVLKRLTGTTNKPTPTSADVRCSGSSNGAKYPNNAYGSGIINVAKAMA